MDDRDLTNAIKHQTLRTCEKCGSDKFFEGPSGGVSTNYICANPKCRARYNVSPFGYQFVGFDPSEEDTRAREMDAEHWRNNRRLHYYNKGSNYYLEGKMTLSVVMERIDYKVDKEANLYCSLDELRNHMMAGFIDTLILDLQPQLHRGKAHGKEVEEGTAKAEEHKGSPDAPQGSSGTGSGDPGE